MEFAPTRVQMRKKIVRIALIVVGLPLLYVAAVLLYATATDFNPPYKEDIQVQSQVARSANDSVYSAITWNLGFTGLGAETDFFYDGGTVVTQTEALVTKNREGICKFVAANADVDVYLFQEVDSTAKRSHYVNLVEELAASLPGFVRSFALNYNVDFVPIPFLDPMGKVKSGLASFSNLTTTRAERRSYDSQFSWPTRLFFLDRCFLAQIAKLDDGTDICFINTHCSAYDTAGVMVANEIKRLMSYADSVYKTGTTVIIGGDWNQCPPGYQPKDPKTYNEYILSDDQLPANWRWVADIETPTNRKMNTVYHPETSYTSVIDHFVVSPDVEVVGVKTINLDFAFSDHQPIRLDFRVRK